MQITRRNYMRALGFLSTVSFSGFVSEDVAASTSDNFGLQEPVPTGSTRVSVDNPHITLGHGVNYNYGQKEGIPNLTRVELATEALKLHPDFWNQRYYTGGSGDPFYFERAVPQSARDGIDLAATLGVPASLGFGWMPRDVPVEERPAERQMSGYLYDLPSDEQWPAPDGTPAEKPLHQSTTRDIDGNVKTYLEVGNLADYSVSMHAPGPTGYHLDNHENAPLYGANATEMDLANEPSNLMRGDYSIWGKRAFRKYLQDLPPSRLDRLGIDNISDFDIQSYAQNLRDEVYSGTLTEEDAVQDPVMFEFRLMENLRILEFYETYANQGHASAETVESPLTTLGNQQTRIVSTKSNAAITLSQVYDLIEVENPITIPDQETGSKFFYLSSIRTATHKLVAAIKQAVDKPVVEHGFYGTGGWDGDLDPTNRYPTLQTLNFAEVYANGSTRQLDLSGFSNLPLDNISLIWLDRESKSVPEDIRPLADFLWLHKQDLQGAPQSDVAVVYSMPTMLGKIRPFVGRHGDQEAKSVDWWVRAARERQIPTDMVIFGHPELWDDSNTLGRLSEYQTLIFPQVSALTDSQFDAVQEFVNGGGTVLFEGNIGTHDGYYRPRTKDITDQERVIDVSKAGSQATKGDIALAGDTIEQTLESPLVQVDGPSTLSCEVLESEDGWKNVHLVNYDYNSDQDAIRDVSEVSVSLRDSEAAVQEVDIIAPFDDRKSLDTERKGNYVSVTVPQISVWGIVRFKTETRTSTATESEAKKAIEEASKGLNDVSDTGRSIPVAKGEAAIYEAELAKGAHQYDRAIEKAEVATEQTDSAEKELHIGIDSGHGQSPERTYDGLTEFREKYGEKYEISFSEITAITAEDVAELDGILIGSAFDPDAYSYSEEELAVLERFVNNGGRIAVVVRNGINEGINSVTELFGITVDPRTIYTVGTGNQNSIRTEPAQYRTPITYQILEEGWEPQACSLTNLEDGVAVQIQSKPNTVRKHSSERNQFPVSAVSWKGDGAVVVQTTDKLFSTLKFQFEVQARNILRFIGDAEEDIDANDLTPEPANPSSSRTTNTDPAVSSSSQTEKITRTSSPGFGTISAFFGFISAVGYAIYTGVFEKSE